MSKQSLQQRLDQVQVNLLYQKVLQASVLDLVQICEEFIEENPMLEFEKVYSGPSLYPEYLYQSISVQEKFADNLKKQIAYINPEPAISEIAMFIADLIDRDGYLHFSVDEISTITGASLSTVEKALAVIQSLEPPGIGARDFLECFMLQMRAKQMENSPVFTMISRYGKDLLAGKFSRIKKEMNLTDSEFLSIMQEMGKLNPFPVRAFSHSKEVVSLFPDVIIKSIDPVSIEFGEDRMFKIFLNEKYIRLLKSQSIGTGERQFLKEKLSRARKFLLHIENRRKFLEKIIGYIVEYQKDFFCGKGSLKPLSEKNLAEKFDCSQSLISRAVSGKYIACGKKILLIRGLFSYATEKRSQDFIAEEIKNIIKDSNAFLSDRQIAEILKERGISIAPRTVNKYRRKKEILNSYVRRSLRMLGNKE
ncbi:MAG: hypothetical protein ACP5JO_01280 [Candidatus Ratteibacteria bacterium]